MRVCGHTISIVWAIIPFVLSIAAALAQFVPSAPCVAYTVGQAGGSFLIQAIPFIATQVLSFAQLIFNALIVARAAHDTAHRLDLLHQRVLVISYFVNFSFSVVGIAVASVFVKFAPSLSASALNTEVLLTTMDSI